MTCGSGWVRPGLAEARAWVGTWPRALRQQARCRQGRDTHQETAPFPVSPPCQPSSIGGTSHGSALPTPRAAAASPQLWRRVGEQAARHVGVGSGDELVVGVGGQGLHAPRCTEWCRSAMGTHTQAPALAASAGAGVCCARTHSRRLRPPWLRGGIQRPGAVFQRARWHRLTTGGTHQALQHRQRPQDEGVVRRHAEGVLEEHAAQAVHDGPAGSGRPTTCQGKWRG